MTVKNLIEILKGFNLNAEVRIVTDRAKGDTAPATLISVVDENPRYFGFFQGEDVPKKKSKKIVIA